LRVTHRQAERSGSSSQYRCDPCDKRSPDCPHPTISASTIDPVVWEKAAAVLSDPKIIACEVERRRSDGSLDRDRAALDRRIEAIADKQSRMARRVADIDDDEAAAPLMVELKSLAAQKTTALRERETLERRMADRADEDARVRSLADWCSRVGTNLNLMSYEQKRLALDALGTKVRIYKLGSTDADGNPLPRWEITMRPTSGEQIVNSSTRSS
ncbi:MAG TPA: hypothetical protein VK356_12290, partial [Thermomicrobiales bacterium]|nr:hypothetical protein [Thermomicrobiales bacterium]